MTSITAPVQAPAQPTPGAIVRRVLGGILRNALSIIAFIIGLGLINNAATLPPGTITTFTFGENTGELPIDAALASLVFAFLYIAGGAFLLLPGGSLPGRADARQGAGRFKPPVRVMIVLLFLPASLVIAAAGNSVNLTVMLSVSVRLAVPIVMGALAGIWCERAGVVNIAIEGMMLTGACFGFVAYTLLLPTTPSGTALLAGVITATLSGGLMALLHGWLSITYRTNQVVSGTVINILALGVTSFVRREVLLSSEAGRETLQPIRLPILGDLPVVGEILFSGRPIFYSMFVLLFVTHIVLFYTRWGLRTRAVGENPRAADTLGVNVLRTRWLNVIIGGLIAGLAGAWFSLETNGSFDDNMTSGRGFIGLAAMIFGNYMPFGAFAGGLLFGFSDALGQRFQFLGVAIPAQFLQMVPYVVTIVVLTGLGGRARAPKAGGIPYEKEGK
jgi:simple sugar transport system permease protein